jgi:hypothetical protein
MIEFDISAQKRELERFSQMIESVEKSRKDNPNLEALSQHRKCLEKSTLFSKAVVERKMMIDEAVVRLAGSTDSGISGGEIYDIVSTDKTQQIGLGEVNCEVWELIDDSILCFLPDRKLTLAPDIKV